MKLVKQSDLGSMLLATVRYALRVNGGYTVEYTASLVRRHFAGCDDYDKRQIVNEIELALALDRELPTEREEWSTLVEEIRPTKAPFTVEYRCGRCKAKGLKLWRGVHGCDFADGSKLLCAACLVPGETVDDDGRAPCELLHGQKTDQVGKVDDTFWGYSSVPTADVRWWKALPTYAPRTEIAKRRDK